MKGKLALSFADQIIVSGGNFLTIALGAHLLSLSEQGKLAYVTFAYMGTVILNVSAIFAVAPIVKQEATSPGCYFAHLFNRQIALALASAAVVCGSILILGRTIGWESSQAELAALAVFLVLQQLADFKRRAAYIFADISDACMASVWTYGVRLALLIGFRPDSVLEVLVILALGALVSALLANHDRFSLQTSNCNRNEQKAIRNLHQRLSFWITLNAPIGWSCFFLPVFILGGVYSEQAAAVFGSVRSVANVANVALELLETFVPAWLAVTAANQGHSQLKKASLGLLLAGAGIWVLGLFVIVLIGADIVRIALGAAYVPYSHILLISWFGNGIHFAGRVASLYYRTRKNTRLEFFASTGGAVGLVVAIPIIQKYGIDGAAWSYVFVSTGMLAAQFICARSVGNVRTTNQ